MGRFQFWLLAAFALSLFSLFFIQIKSRLAALTQVFNTVAISAFIVALSLVREVNYSAEFHLSPLNKRILLFATAAHFLAQYFLFFKRNIYSPWWSFFGQLSLWGLFIFLSAQNVILLFAAYFLMSMPLFIIFTRSSEPKSLLSPASYLTQISSYFSAGLSLVFFSLALGNNTLGSGQFLSQTLFCLGLILFLITLILEMNIFPLGKNLLQIWKENYSQFFYALFIIYPALVWALMVRFKELSLDCSKQSLFIVLITLVSLLSLALWSWKAYKNKLFQNRMSLMFRVNAVMFFAYLLLPDEKFSQAYLAYSLLAVGASGAALHCLFYRQDFTEEVFEGLFYKNKYLSLLLLLFSGSLVGFPLTSTFFFRLKTLAHSEGQYLYLLIEILGMLLLLSQFYFLARTIFTKNDKNFYPQPIEKYRLILVSVLALATLYGGFWPFMRF